MPDLLAEITRAAKAYYAQASSLGLTVTDFHDWVASRPSGRQEEVRQRGFTPSLAEPAFLRYCLHWRGHDMRAFMAARLSVAAFTLWAANGEFNGDLPPHGIAR